MLDFRKSPLDLATIGCRTDEVRFCLGQVGFIHRTAHDFLAETGAGRCILNHQSDPQSPADVVVTLMRSLIDVARTLHPVRYLLNVDSAIDALVRVAHEFESPANQAPTTGPAR